MRPSACSGRSASPPPCCCPEPSAAELVAAGAGARSGVATAGSPGLAGAAPLRLEHPTGAFDVSVELDPGAPADRPRTRRAGLVRTARKLFDGTVFPRPA